KSSFIAFPISSETLKDAGYFSFIMITLEQRSELISKIIPVASVICKGLIEPRISFVQEIIIPISYYL
ncbi:MAG: hypothetical protein E6789_09290, partial [Clostridium baratii]|nr:hypothetical protein [Clostridium baratii]